MACGMGAEQNKRDIVFPRSWSARGIIYSKQSGLGGARHPNRKMVTIFSQTISYQV